MGHGVLLAQNLSLPLTARSRPLRMQRKLLEPTSQSQPCGENNSVFPEHYGEVQGPNISDKETILSLAKMSQNAYVAESSSASWQDIHSPFNYSQGFGWQNDGLRGHIYTDEDNSTIIMALKGTSVCRWSNHSRKMQPSEAKREKQFLTAQERQLMIRTMTICSSAVVVDSKVTSSGDRSVTVRLAHIPLIRHA